MSVEVIPIETPHTLIVDGSDTHFMSGRDFRIDAVAESMIGKGGWEKNAKFLRCLWCIKISWIKDQPVGKLAKNEHPCDWSLAPVQSQCRLSPWQSFPRPAPTVLQM